MAQNHIFSQAINPTQYDSQQINWNDEHDLKSPSRAFAWSFISKFPNLFTEKDILDVGAGTGWLISEMNRLNPKSITAIEPSKNNFEFLKKKFDNVELFNDSFESFSKMEKYDTIIMVWVTPHIKDIKKTFKKVSKLLRKNGHFLTINLDYNIGQIPRFGYQIEIEEIDNQTYAALTHRAQGKMADIYRTVESYKMAGEASGMKLENLVQMKPTDQLVSEVPGYKRFIDHPISNLMIFKKTV